MEKYPRFYNKERLDELVVPGRVLIVYGPRRAGKTTLIEEYLRTVAYKMKKDSGENTETQDILSSGDFPRIFGYIEGVELLFIDEAQRIPKIGEGLKILVDHRPELRIIVTGSSSFDLAQQIGEPLTGRRRVITLYPFAQRELRGIVGNAFELTQRLPEFLVYGSYPQVLTAPSRSEREAILLDLVDTYLLRDVLAFERLRSPALLRDLLKLLAFQIGREVSLHELATELRKWHPQTDPKTVGRYLHLLELSFVITRVGGFSRNLRKEVGSKQKYYFLDNGVRNAIIRRLQPLDVRDDIGYLWENFVVMERFKKRSFDGIYGDAYFWRTYDGQEIDLVEDRDGVLHGYEIKWGMNKEVSAPRLWKSTYPDATFDVVTPKNYLDFVG